MALSMLYWFCGGESRHKDRGRRLAPGEVQMNAVKVTIRYLDSKVVHSRYGYTRRLETVVRFVPEDQLEEE